jgi:hypothetical protein
MPHPDSAVLEIQADRSLVMNGAPNFLFRWWLKQLLIRRPLNAAVAALANKMARTAWALVAHRREYTPEWKSAAPTSCAAKAVAA